VAGQRGNVKVTRQIGTMNHVKYLRLGLPAFGLLTVDAEHQVGQLGNLLQVGVQRGRVEQDGGLPGGLPEGSGQVFDHFSGILDTEV